MIFGILVILLLIILYFVFINKLRIDFKSFFKKGFKRNSDNFGLFCYTGKQGKGKTFSAIQFLEKYEKDHLIITNVSSYATSLHMRGKKVLYVKTLEECVDSAISLIQEDEKIIIFFDEIFTVLEKRKDLPKYILSFLSQLRKRKIILITTAQEWSEIQITFRRYCRLQISCNMFEIPIVPFSFYINTVNDGDQIKWDDSEQEFIAPTIFTTFGKCNKKIVDLYNTYETIAIS